MQQEQPSAREGKQAKGSVSFFVPLHGGCHQKVPPTLRVGLSTGNTLIQKIIHPPPPLSFSLIPDTDTLMRIQVSVSLSLWSVKFSEYSCHSSRCFPRKIAGLQGQQEATSFTKGMQWVIYIFYFSSLHLRYLRASICCVQGNIWGSFSFSPCIGNGIYHMAFSLHFSDN